MLDALPQINRSRCTGCGDCIAVCPANALAQIEGKAVLADPDACTLCAACEEVCPVFAIDLPFLIIRAPLEKESTDE